MSEKELGKIRYLALDEHVFRHTFDESIACVLDHGNIETLGMAIQTGEPVKGSRVELGGPELYWLIVDDGAWLLRELTRGESTWWIRSGRRELRISSCV